MKETTNQKRRVLIVEDDAVLRDTLARFLARVGYDAAAASDGRGALALLDESPPDVVLTDIHMPDVDGLELLAEVKTRYPDTIVIMMTAFSSIDTAVEAMRRGAEDYLSKPLQLADAQMSIERALERRSLRTRVAQLESQARERYQFSQIIGRSAAMQRVFQIIERVAPTGSTVLIQGRTGTGKELVARAIHFNSPRAKKPLVDINCGALPENLIESELFGHQKGAFTGANETKKGLFETAHGGTLFLDEVQALRPELQTRLLRALQERVIRRVGGRENIEVDVRVIAATNQDIAEAVRKGEFREDLYYRLNVVGIHLPDLRERREDIPLLVEHFLKRFAEANHQEPRRFSREAMRLLAGYDWPGNVRELQNAVEYALAIGTGPMLTIADLPPHISGIISSKGAPEPVGEGRTLEEVERRHILRILEETGGNHVRAAEILGIDRRTLYRKLEKYRLPTGRITE
ncbi:MAG TPA: sigma-54 dependent transcriptional regulator [Blastocatellia bacterium]|nr:sigma-54 dependent transcriptional regulator [Blastocatellia bacterium]